LKQIGLGMHNYANTVGGFPPSFTTGTVATAPHYPFQHAWSAALLPYIEQTQAFNLYTYKANWNDPVNYSAIQTYMVVFNCPSTPVQPRQDTTIAAQPSCGDYNALNAIKNFVAVNCFGYTSKQLTNKNDPRLVGAIRRDEITTFEDISDGTSNTLLIAEDAGRSPLYTNDAVVYDPVGIGQGGWADPNGAFSYDGSNPNCTMGNDIPGPCPLNCSNNSEIYSFHTGGANVVMADGSVHFLAEDINFCLLAAMYTRAGGEVVTRFD
jgi:prepilin-type processing-associated H-X9-DG protein